MLIAVKGNKQLQIDDAEKGTYLKLGYDIAEVEGEELKVVEASPAKTVPYAKYQEVLNDNEALQEKVAELEKKVKADGK